MRLTRLFMLTTAVLLTLVSIMLVRGVMQEWRTVSAAERGLRAMGLTQLAMKIAEKASFERGPTNVVLGDGDERDPAKRKRMMEARKVSDDAIDAALKALADSMSADHRAAVAQIEKSRDELARARAETERVAALPFAERSGENKNIVRVPVGKMFGVIDTALETVSILSADAERIYPELSQALVGARLAAELREYAGRLGSQLTTPIGAEMALGMEERRDIPVLIGHIEQLRQLIEVSARANATDMQVTLAIAEMNKRYFKTGILLIDSLTAAGMSGNRYGMDLATFVARYVPEMASIVKLRDTMFEVARGGATQRLARAKRDLQINGIVGLLVLLVEIAVFLLIRRRVLQPLLANTQAVVDIAEGRLGTPPPDSRRQDEIGDMQRAVAALRQTSLDKQRIESERDQLIDQLQYLSRIDHLTSLMNRRAFEETFMQQLAIASRANWPVALVMFDLDHFKVVNDTHGHATGDIVLKQVAAIARGEFRLTDMLARYGGEEFIALLINCNADFASAFAERVRAAVEKAELKAENGEVFRITSSFGVVSTAAVKIADIAVIIKAADDALYRAKNEGRNRVVTATA